MKVHSSLDDYSIFSVALRDEGIDELPYRSIGGRGGCGAQPFG